MSKNSDSKKEVEKKTKQPVTPVAAGMQTC